MRFAVGMKIGKEGRKQAKERQVGAKNIDVFNARAVGDPTERSCAKTRKPEGKAEEQSGDGANLAGHQKMQARTAGILEMHQTDASARGISSGDAVEVFNGRGRIALHAVINEQVAAGVVSARLDWNKLSAGASNVNALTSERLTDIGGGPTFYSTLVEVRKVS